MISTIQGKLSIYIQTENRRQAKGDYKIRQTSLTLEYDQLRMS